MKVLIIIGKIISLVILIPLSFIVLGVIGMVAFVYLLFDNERRKNLIGNG